MGEDIKCQYCGKGIDASSRICPHCGKGLQPGVSLFWRKHNAFGLTALILGIIGMSLVWTPIYLNFLSILILAPIGILAMIFGSIGFFRKNQHDFLGLTGFILGLLTGIIGAILFFRFTF